MAETVETLRLDSDVAKVAAEGATAVDKLSNGLKAAGEAAESIKTKEWPKWEEVLPTGETAKDAKDGIKGVATELDKARKAAEEYAKAAKAHDKQSFGQFNKTPLDLQASPKALSSFQLLLQGVSKIFGPQAAGTLASGAGSLAAAADKFAPFVPMMKMAAVPLLAAAAALAAVIVAIGIAAFKLVEAGAKLSIASTTFREKAVAGLETVVKDASRANALYDVGIKLAVDLDLDKDKTIQRVKGLIATGFRDEDVIPVITAVSDLTIVKGEEAGQALQKQLEKTAAKNVFNQESINALAEAGIKAEDVYAKLAIATGKTVDQVKSAVKTGQIDARTGMQAILDAVEQTAGGAAKKAANNVPGILGGIRIQIESLFDSVDLGPLKGALNNVSTALSGPGGEKLKSAVTEFFGTAFKTLFGSFEGEEGGKKLEQVLATITGAIKVATTALKIAQPFIQNFINGLVVLFGKNESGDTGPVKTIRDIRDLLTSFVAMDFEGVKTALGSLFSGFDVTGLIGDITGLGSDIIDGLVSGISSGASRVVDAISGVAQNAIASAKGILGIRSRSKVFAQIGNFTVEGFLSAMEGGKSAAGEAGQGLAARAVKGAAGVAAANDNAATTIPGQGMARGEGAFLIEIHIHLPGGAAASPEASQEAAQTAATAVKGVVSSVEFRRQFAALMREYAEVV